MAIYTTVNGRFEKMTPTTFEAAGLKERADLQRFLKQQIEVVSPDTLIIAEEFGDWADSRRRIDLLGIDRQANLVVVEIKRTEDGGHMDLQAIRYAAMVSAMTFDNVVSAYEEYAVRNEMAIADARQALLKFLGPDEYEVETFPTDVRVVLASADFSPEITTTVLWLNEYGLDIRCVRLRPYHDAGRLLVDVQQIIPLPEAEEYQVRIREKKVLERAVRATNRDLTKFALTIDGERFTALPKRRAIFKVIKVLCDWGIDPEAIRRTLSWKSDLLCDVAGEESGAALQLSLSNRLIELGRQANLQRYFIEAEELIRAHGRTYVVSNQWGGRTRRALDELIESFGAGRIGYTVAGPEEE